MARKAMVSVAAILLLVTFAIAQPPSETANPGDSPTNVLSDAAGQPGNSGTDAISGNPGAVNIVTGTGALGELLGFDKDSGVRIGGLWLGDSNWLATGGLQPGKWSLDGLTLVDVTLDAEKLVGWKGGMFGIEFLQLAADPVNGQAGAFPGYNSITGPPPLIRQEIYELWWRQTFFDDKLIVRIGKSSPTYDFNNVVRPVPTGDPAASVPAVSGLIYTPIFVNPTIIGRLPGFYNSTTGITATVAPNPNWYLSYGFYDGSLANGTQTGLWGPQFNGYYFHIAELGHSWRIGPQKKPGMSAIGIWGQTGKLPTPSGGIENGEVGVYAFGSQRLWFRNPGMDNSGISGFYQLGANSNDSSTDSSVRRPWPDGVWTNARTTKRFHGRRYGLVLFQP